MVEFSTASFVATLVLCSHVLGALAAMHAVMTVRTAPGAIAWAGSLLLIPYVALVPYLVFGSSNFVGYVNARRFYRAQMRELREGMEPRDQEACIVRNPAQPGLLALSRLTGLACLSGNHVDLLIDGTQTFDAILGAIARARRVVLVQFFIVHDDELGRRLAAALCERVAAGVRVFFLYDSIGCHGLPRHYVRRLADAGVAVSAFAPHKGFVNRFQLNFRNHRKLVIVDGGLAFLGGHNVGNEYLGLMPPLAPWRDTHVAVRGPAVLDLQITFAEDWYWAERQVPTLLLPPSAPAGEMVCQVVPTGPADSQETCSLFFVQAIQSAHKRLWITSPYFVPDEAVFAVLRLAVLRGVDVRILLPDRADHRVVFAASTLYAHQAIAAGIRIYRYRPGFLHQKVMLIDDELAAVGTANLDNRSFRLNFELMLLTADRSFASRVEGMLLADFAQAREIGTDEFLDAPAWRRMAMHVAKLFAPIL